MSMKTRQNVYGADVGEYCHLYFKNKELPFTFVGIGVTYPNKKYYIHRNSVDYYDIELITKGKGHLQIGNKTFELHEGDIFIIEPGIEHSYYGDPKDPFEKIWIAFTSTSFEALYKSLNLNNIFVFTKNVELKKVFEETIIIGKTSNYSDDVQFKLGILVNEIIYSLAQKIAANPNDISLLAESVKELLDSSIFGNITVSNIAEKLNYSVKQIGRVFEKYYAVTPYQYLLNCKIEMAKALLISTNIPIKEISKRLGFNNQNSFSNSFKLKVGISPSQFKTNN